MKKLAILSTFFAFYFSACANFSQTTLSEQTLENPNVENVIVALDSVNDLEINEQEAKNALIYELNKTELKYPSKINAVYKSTLTSNTPNTTSFTQTTEQNAQVLLELTIISKNKTTKANGKAQISVSVKKVLEIGENPKVSKKDIQSLLTHATKAAFDQANNL